MAAVVLAAGVLPAGSVGAQSLIRTAAGPQPAAAASPAVADLADPRQASGTKPAGQTAKPAPGKPQAPRGNVPPPKKKAPPPRTSKVWKGRGFAVVGAGVQLAAPGYTSSADFKVHAENATLNADASVGIGPVFGARGGVRVWKNMALGAGLAVASTSQTLQVTGRLPHPFQFNEYREVEGTADGLDRLETLVAFEVSWYAALSRRVDMFIFGGPAYINVRQDMATRIQFTESYPYDTATFTGVDTASANGGGFGATGGIDVTYLVTKHVGIGGEVRYSYASTTLSPSGQPTKVGLGGLQTAVGARILF